MKNRIAIGFIILIVYSAIVTYLLFSRNSKPVKSDNSSESNTQSTMANPEDTLPFLPFPVSIFEKNNIGMGSASASGGYEWAVIPGEADTITEPTTTITLSPKSYSNETTVLPPIVQDSVLFKQKNSVGGIPFEDVMHEQISKYGDLARRFIVPDEKNITCTAGNEFISSITEADVDKDGKNEQIIGLYTVGANPWVTRALIVKDNKVVFTAGCDSKFPDIIPSKSGNGFTLEWGDNFKKRIGYVKTRFIWQDGKFSPIFEQTIRYVKVGAK